MSDVLFGAVFTHLQTMSSCRFILVHGIQFYGVTPKFLENDISLIKSHPSYVSSLCFVQKFYQTYTVDDAIDFMSAAFFTISFYFLSLTHLLSFFIGCESGSIRTWSIACDKRTVLLSTPSPIVQPACKESNGCKGGRGNNRGWGWNGCGLNPHRKFSSHERE